MIYTLKALNKEGIGKYQDIEVLSKGYYEEKKSKFYSYVFSISSKEEAENVIKKWRELYKDSRHLVYAYSLENLSRYSDDGEPSGTAGKVLYTYLQNKKIINALIIVIRYFGGILLGSGLLTRAYSKTMLDALKKCEEVEYQKTENIKLIFNYSDESRILNKIEKYKGEVISKEYLENVTFSVVIPEKSINNFQKWIK
ncbi:MAG: YigZ family protein [Clostridia bacterium]|nr:YigZ family protein [Clostridia bacterium]MDD4376032.1 YigZ family protein [Clostridia bacterium]